MNYLNFLVPQGIRPFTKPSYNNTMSIATIAKPRCSHLCRDGVVISLWRVLPK